MNTSQPDNRPVKIYRINDCDWYVAHSLEEAKEAALKDYDGDSDLVDDAHELTDEEMNTFQFWDSDNTDKCDPEHYKCPCGYTTAGASPCNRWTGNEWQHLHDNGEGFVTMKNISRVSFVEYLGKHLKLGLPVPGLFASTEY